MAVSGGGVACSPLHAIESELEQGTLVQAFAEWPELTIPLEIVCYRSKGTTRPAVEQFWQGNSQVVERTD